MKQPLHIGFVVNKNCELPAWEYEILAQISKSNSASVLVIPISVNQVTLKSSFLYRLFTKFENWWFGDKYNAFEKMNIKKEFEEIIYPLFETDALKNLNFDILYISYLTNIDLKSLPHPTYGYWKIVLGKDKYKSALPAAFCEEGHRSADQCFRSHGTRPIHF